VTSHKLVFVFWFQIIEYQTFIISSSYFVSSHLFKRLVSYVPAVVNSK